jgi:hypothetical protein
MSKDRALRRAAREAEEQAARAARARQVARRAKRREIRRRLTPRLPKRGRVGKLFPRRTASQRAWITAILVIVLFLIWYEVDDLRARIAMTAVALLVAPAIVVLAFGRRSS